jgi:aromatic ring-cleaving dioxygenase
MCIVTGYHAHVYFDAADRATAERLCKQAQQKFSVADACTMDPLIHIPAAAVSWSSNQIYSA